MQYSAAERFVLLRIAAGQVADLRKPFPGKTDRKLRASFLQNLLSGEQRDIGVHWNGVRITGAQFEESINLSTAEIAYETQLDACEFGRGVDLSDSHFKRNLSFDGSTFNSTSEPADFSGMRVEGDLRITEGTIFYGVADFGQAEINGQFVADTAQFKVRSAKESANFNGLKVKELASFKKATFSGGVSFGHAEIGNQLVLDDARFTDQSVRVNLNGVKTGDMLSLKRAVFAGGADLGHAEVGGVLIADEAQFDSDDRPVTFNGMKVRLDAHFDSTIFSGPTDFRGAEIDGEFVARGVSFKNTKENADFNSMRVLHTASLDGAVFFGPVDFSYSDFRAGLAVGGASFSYGNRNAEATFSGMQVGHNALFDNGTVFGGPVTFDEAEVKGDFVVSSGLFRNPQARVNFTGMKVRGTFSLIKHSVFSGSVDFGNAQIDGNFLAEKGTAFSARNPSKEASFVGLRVGASANFSGVTFGGPVSFDSAQIGLQLLMDGAEFQGANALANFDSVKIGDKLSFRHTRFKGSLSVKDAEAKDITLLGNENTPMQLDKLTFRRTLVRGELSIQSVRASQLIASSLQVHGPTLLADFAATDEIDFQHAKFQTLELKDLAISQHPRHTHLEGAVYEELAGNNSEVMREWIKSSPFGAEPYATLETFYRAHEQPEIADDIFVEMKRRERRDVLRWESARWWWNLLLDGVVRFGRSPERAFIWSAILVVIGTFVFNRSRMEPQKPEHPSTFYHPFWYSLDLLTPFIDLQAASEWMPRQGWRFGRNYSRIHRLLGWVLIPIGLAAVTGIIGR